MRRTISKDMLEAAARQGWSIAQTARHYGYHQSSINAACARHGVTLAMGLTSPNKVSPRRVDIPPPSTKRVKAFSANPVAIQKALESHKPR